MKNVTPLISSFETLIKEGFLYVDKTKIIYDLIAKGRFLFLARPRRFGKTLLISTLRELFSGKKELFKDLWIYTSDYSWKEYPVLTFDFSTIDRSSPENFEKSLAFDLDLKAKQFSIDLLSSSLPGDKLKALILSLAERNKVVILIDEYDSPIINNVNDLEVMDKIRGRMRNFFDIVKSLSGDYLHAIVITGVSQIPKASIFSGLSNLKNISLDVQAAALLGYTKEELITYFSDYITYLAHLKKTSEDVMLSTIQSWYNGYQFSKKDEKVYNPFSLNNLFIDNEFSNYWFRSGTPSFLPALLKKNRHIIETTVEGAVASEDTLSILNVENPQFIPLLFQTGYLTISSYSERKESYTLKFPNQEVKKAYNFFLLSTIIEKSEAELTSITHDLRDALFSQDTARLCSLLDMIFAGISYQIDERKESSYHSIFHAIITTIGLEPYSEVQTNDGRIDTIVKCGSYLYIFEFKIDATAKEALEQIEHKEYYKRFLISHEKRTIILVGLAFNKINGKATSSCAHKKIDQKK